MLSTGTEAPDFSLQDQNGRTVRLSDLLADRHVVLFFYPKDNTLVCTIEVCAFRDAFDDLSAVDATVVGISIDSVASHLRTAERWRLNYPLLADPGGKVAAAYEVERSWGLFRGRVTYVIGQDGLIKGATNDPLRAGVHVRNALAVLKPQEIV